MPRSIRFAAIRTLQSQLRAVIASAAALATAHFEAYLFGTVAGPFLKGGFGALASTRRSG
jgi:hypothetical protein